MSTRELAFGVQGFAHKGRSFPAMFGNCGSSHELRLAEC